jgi:hypothetical protein
MNNVFNLKGPDGTMHEYRILRKDKDGRYKISVDSIPEKRLVTEYCIKRYAEIEKEASND